MKRTPLLDLGNVVIQVDFQPFLRWLASAAGKAGPQQVSPLLRSSLFYDFEFGHISKLEFARRLAKLYGASFTQAELEEHFCSIFPGAVDGIAPVLEELAAEGPVYCLTNTNEIHLSYLRGRFPEMQMFSRVFASHEMGRRKPYPGIYREVAQELGLDHRDLIFFDDMPANVRGAIRAGLEAHVFDGAEGMRGVLAKPPAKPESLVQLGEVKEANESDDNVSGGGLNHG